MKIVEWEPILITKKVFVSDKLNRIVSLVQLAGFLFFGFCYYVSSDYVILYYPLIISSFLLGIPHGAADHLFIWGFGKFSISQKIFSLLLYIALCSCYIFLWLNFPLLGFFLFLLLTCYHWGSGDYIYDLMSGRLSRNDHSCNIFYSLYKGSIPLVVPGVFHTDSYNMFITSICTAIDESLALHPLQISRGFFVATICTSFVLYRLAFFSCSKRDSSIKIYKFESYESIGLVFWFALLPPIYAIGVYFMFWHSLRHILRIFLLDGKCLAHKTQYRLKPLLVRYLQLFTVMTISTFILYLIFFAYLDLKITDENVVNILLILIAGLTFPHTVTVTIMDYRQINGHNCALN